MSDLTSDCKPNCWERVTCRSCGRTKTPRGRSASPEASSGYCTYDCADYWSDPKPGHLWPNEARTTPKGTDGGEG